MEKTNDINNNLNKSSRKRGRPRKNINSSVPLIPVTPVIEQEITVLNETTLIKEEVVNAVEKINDINNNLNKSSRKRGRPSKNINSSIPLIPVTPVIEQEITVLNETTLIKEEVVNAVEKINAKQNIIVAFTMMGILFFILVAYISFYFLNNSKISQINQKINTIEQVEIKKVNDIVPILETLPVKIIDNNINIEKEVLNLKLTKNLEDNIIFAAGAVRLGPLGREKAKDIINNVNFNIEQLYLYGYSGPFKNKQKMSKLALDRAISTKIYMVNELGAEPKDITVVDPKYYLYQEKLPDNTQQVKTVIRLKE